jgi:hypothetical protein
MGAMAPLNLSFAYCSSFMVEPEVTKSMYSTICSHWYVMTSAVDPPAQSK